MNKIERQYVFSGAGNARRLLTLFKALSSYFEGEGVKLTTDNRIIYAHFSKNNADEACRTRLRLRHFCVGYAWGKGWRNW